MIWHNAGHKQKADKQNSTRAHLFRIHVLNDVKIDCTRFDELAQFFFAPEYLGQEQEQESLSIIRVCLIDTYTMESKDSREVAMIKGSMLAGSCASC